MKERTEEMRRTLDEAGEDIRPGTDPTEEALATDSGPAEPVLAVTTDEELRQRRTQLLRLPSGIVIRIRRVNNFMLAQLPLPKEAIRIARETGDPKAAEDALDTSDAITLMQQLIHVGTLEPEIRMPLTFEEKAQLNQERKPHPFTVDDLDNRDFMAAYHGICRFGGLEPLHSAPFPESRAADPGGSDGEAVAGGRGSSELSEASATGVGPAADDSAGGPDGRGDCEEESS